jgi:hypothetical protein
MKHRIDAVPATGFALISLFLAGSVSAHISLEKGGTHLSRDGDANLKDGPCGAPGSTRGNKNVYTYTPGETIEVKIVETIPHPSYFRIAFDKDGNDGFLEPKSIKPIDPARACPFNAADKCGASDFNNSPEVLMDNVDPHASASAGTPYTWQVTLPNVTCDNCTLQVIQVMQDTVHGAYNPVKGDPADLPYYVADIYHQCIDIVLAGDLAPGGDAGAVTSGGTGGAPGSKDSGGCSVGGVGTSRTLAGWYAAALGLAWLRVRGARARRSRVA